MSVLIYVALGFFVVLVVLWEFGFDSFVARVGRVVLRVVSFGRCRVDDTGDPANIVVGGLTIIAFFLLIVFLSGLL